MTRLSMKQGLIVGEVTYDTTFSTFECGGLHTVHTRISRFVTEGLLCLAFGHVKFVPSLFLDLAVNFYIMPWQHHTLLLN